MLIQVGKPEAGKGAWIPMELCTVPGGQAIRPSAPPELMKKLDEKRIKFCVRPPAERLNRLINGLQVRYLKYLELSGSS